MIDRSTILRGPAIVIFDAQTFYSKGDIDVEVDPGTFNIDTSIHGKVDERTSQRVAKIRFTPVGEWEALTVLHPWAGVSIGTSMFGAVDKPLVIHTKDGKTVTFKAACVVQPPNIILSAEKTLWGDVEFHSIGMNNTDWTVADSFMAVASLAFADTTFNSANIITQPYSGVWGAVAPWNSFQTVDGFVIAPKVSYKVQMTDTDGPVDYTFESLDVSATCQPLGVTEANIMDALKLQGAGNRRGRSLTAGGLDLVITGATGAVIVTLKKAAMRKAGYKFAPADPRIAPVEFIATRTFAAGVAEPLYSLAA